LISPISLFRSFASSSSPHEEVKSKKYETLPDLPDLSVREVKSEQQKNFLISPTSLFLALVFSSLWTGTW